jgi:hypothetical protein
VLDDAIVVIEHLAHRAAEGVPVRDAMVEIAPTLIARAPCTLAIFVPFMALGGLTGAFFRVLALSIAFMLTASLAICLLYVSWIPLGKKPHEERPGRVQRLHERALEFVRGRRWAGVPRPARAGDPAVAAVEHARFRVPPRDGRGLADPRLRGAARFVCAETDRILRLIEKRSSPFPRSWRGRAARATSSASSSPSRTPAITCSAWRKTRERDAEEIAEDLPREDRGRSSPRSRSSSAS